jgi:hypothetical protein
MASKARSREKVCGMCGKYIGNRNDCRVMRCKPCQFLFLKLLRDGNMKEIIRRKDAIMRTL